MLYVNNFQQKFKSLYNYSLGRLSGHLEGVGRGLQKIITISTARSEKSS